MSFQVQVGYGGFIGWQVLTRTAEQQKIALANSPNIRQKAEYLRENIANIDSAEQLVADFRMLDVALTAYGLEGDIRNKFFIQKVLSEGASDTDAFATRLSDKRYANMARAFAFDLSVPSTKIGGFADKLIDTFIDREFERQVGAADTNLRLALNAKRELAALANRQASDNTKWYEVLGSPPLRAVFEGAFGFGSAYGKLPIDRQLDEFANKAESVFGSRSLEIFSEPEQVEKLIRTFLLRSQAAESASHTGYSTALALLSS